VFTAQVSVIPVFKISPFYRFVCYNILCKHGLWGLCTEYRVCSSSWL